MENHDKIFDQIKKAALSDQPDIFPAMDKVWARVEDKLDSKVLKKENKLWKKISVAATILLAISIGYHYMSSDTDKITPQEQIVTAPIQSDPISAPEPVAASSATNSDIIKPDASDILNQHLQTTSPVVATAEAVQESIAVSDNAAFGSKKEDAGTVSDKAYVQSERNGGEWLRRNILEARVVSSQKKKVTEARASYQPAQSKQSPLMVVDGIPVRNDAMDTVRALNANDIEKIEVLTDPLYIINGEEFTEKSLFGERPWSPYAPLSEQDIETITILTGPAATGAYGNKAKKGVVIITTTTGKPK